MSTTVAPAFTTPDGTRGWKRWLVYSPLARIVIFILSMVLFGGILGAVDRAVFGAGAFSHARSVLASPVAATVYISTFVTPAVLAYLVLTLWIERRAPGELALRRLPRGFGVGALGGFALFSTVVGVLWIAGSFHVTGTDPRAHWALGLLATGLGAGIGEEILFRGVLFRITEEGVGTWCALAISALFFGCAHLGNPNATPWSALAIAIEAGLPFALIYHLTRSLWPGIGLHAAWNFAEGSIYGVPDSGTRPDGLLISIRTGPHWLSGGNFGVETSLVSVLVLSALTAVLLMIALRRGTIVPPRWRPRRPRAGDTVAV